MVVKHSYRDVNQCSNALTNIGCSFDGGTIFCESCLSNLSHMMIADVIGILIPRLAFFF